MELRDKIRIIFVLTSISTAFMPWMSISFLWIKIDVSLLSMIIGSSELELFSIWGSLGVAYLVASLLLFKWDKAPYVQMTVLILFPVSSIMDAGETAGEVQIVITLLSAITGWGAWAAIAISVLGIIVFAPPRRVKNILERVIPYIPVPVRPISIGRWVRPSAWEREDRYDDGYDIAYARPMAPRPAPRSPPSVDSWWDSEAERSEVVRAVTAVPVIRLPPPGSKNAARVSPPPVDDDPFGIWR